MACPYCGEPEDELDEVEEFEDYGYPNYSVIYHAHCNACGRTFKQRFFLRAENNDYENITEE